MRNNHHVVFTVPKVRGAPVDLNNFTFDIALQEDRIANFERFFDAERQPRENISERILEGKTQNDGDNPGSRNNPLEWQGKNEAEDSQRAADIDASGDNIGQDFVLYRPFAQG